MQGVTTVVLGPDRGRRDSFPGVLSRLARTGELPTLPAAAASALAIARSPEADTDALCDVIGRDVALAARILRVANSVAYGRRKPAKTVPEAVFTVGVRKTCDLLVAAAVRQLYARPHPRAEGLWQHALAVATAAEELAATTQRVAPASAYLPGLFHDVGRIAFLVADPDGLEEIEQRLLGGGPGRNALEIARFEIEHAEAGALLAEEWGLGAAQIDAIRYHHCPADAGEGRALAEILAAADAMAHGLGYGGAAVVQFEPAAIGLSDDDLSFCRDRVQHAFEIQNALLA